MPDYNPWGTPIFPGASAFGVGSPAEDAQRQPTIVDNLLSHIAGALGRGFMAPGQALQSTTPITSEQMIAPAQDMSTMMSTGSGAFPASANELRMGIKAYHGSPHDVEALIPGSSGNYGSAVYHHLDAADAERYRPLGGKVYENELNIQRPFEMDKPVNAADASAILRAMGNDKLADDVAASGRGYFSGSELWYWGMGQGHNQATKAEALKKAGFDSVIGNPGREITGTATRSPEVAVFNNNLIDILRKYAVPGLMGAPILAGAVGEQKS